MRFYRDTALSGKGAALAPGRWNSENVSMVYAAESLAVARLEIEKGLRGSVPSVPFLSLKLSLPADAIDALPDAELPANWQRDPPGDATRRIGDRWHADAASLGLSVPSAAAPGKRNILLNPSHPDVQKIRIDETPLRF